MKVADHSPAASRGSSMKCRTLGRTGTEDGDVALGGERQAGR
jgi:hypothetical protein